MVQLGLSAPARDVVPQAPPAATFIAHDAAGDPLLEFQPESNAGESQLVRVTDAPSPSHGTGARPRVVWFLVIAAVIVQAPITAHWILSWQPVATATTGTVHIETEPVGAEAFVNGKPVGRTPARVSVPRGSGEVELRYPGGSRTLPLTVSAGETIRLRVELATAQPPRAAHEFEEWDPAIAPPVPDGLVPVAAPAPQPHGWISARAPIELQILEQGRPIGVTGTPVALSAGSHALEFAADELRFRVRRDVSVAAGETTELHIDLPSAPLSINAEPWAHVWIGGESVGATPIGNISRPIGLHELVFRHPTLGERRTQVLVSLQAPTRVSVDLRATP